MVSKLDYVPNLPWDIPGWIWDMITFGTSIYPKSEVRFGTYEIRIPVWDIPKLIWDIGSVWATTVITSVVGPTEMMDFFGIGGWFLFFLGNKLLNKNWFFFLM